MTNYEYMKTLSKDEMAKFIMEPMSEAFDMIIDEMCNCWREWHKSKLNEVRQNDK